MVRLTIELEDDTFGGLLVVANQLGVSVETVIVAAVERELEQDEGPTSEFLADVDGMIETYRPVLHRLAQ